MSSKLTRRDFLKLSAAALASYGFRDFPPGGSLAIQRSPAFSMGRTVYSERYYERPTTFSQELGYYVTDTVVNIYEQTLGDPRPTSNAVWLRTDDGWLNSAYVQPVEKHLNSPVTDIPAAGMLMEVTVPYTEAYYMDDNKWKLKYRFYYKTTHWAYYVFTGTTGITWYQVLDDRYGGYYFVQAEHLRPLLLEDVTPLSPGAPDKRLEIDLKKQRLVAYEGQRPVFASRIATGSFPGDTPIGEHRVERKQPSRHMANDFDGDDFDLPGVPWVCYISWTGVSIHGTYWHNNYGTPQSHGCINLSPRAAQWVYRWTEPVVPFGEDFLEAEGTRVIIF